MDELNAYFTEHYLPRREIVSRLPVSVSIQEVWPKILAERSKKAVFLPLHSRSGEMLRYTPTQELLSAGDRIALAFRSEEGKRLAAEEIELRLSEEALAICRLEGITLTEERAGALFREEDTPRDQKEASFLSTLRALRYAEIQEGAPLNHSLIRELGRLLNSDPEAGNSRAGYRDGPVLIVSPSRGSVAKAPKARLVQLMMDELLRYLSDPDIHPLIQAGVAQVYIYMIHPFMAGNLRAARVISDMILMRAGYPFFWETPPSAVLLEERDRFEKSLLASADPDNGNDLTYFIQYFLEALSRAAGKRQQVSLREETLRALESALPAGNTRDRLMKGAARLLKEEKSTVTAGEWQQLFDISFETARQDLNTLERLGLAMLRTEGRKHFYDLRR